MAAQTYLPTLQRFFLAELHIKVFKTHLKGIQYALTIYRLKNKIESIVHKELDRLFSGNLSASFGFNEWVFANFAKTSCLLSKLEN